MAVGIFVCALLVALLAVLTAKTHSMAALIRQYEANGDESGAAHLHTAQNFMYFGLALTSAGIAFSIYAATKGTPWEAHLMEWLNIVVRVMHFTFGIAWIGASFYFVFLENALNRTENVRDELAGNLWAIHGGGFYYLEKYKVAPREIPPHLHWFKYEAYFTWLSGFCLLCIVYYFNAASLLIDKNVRDLSAWQAVGIGVGSFAAGWLLYDRLCRSPLIRRGVWFALIGFAILGCFAWFYTQVFSARAAFIHFGALIGTIMAANVFFIIIPSQKAMVKAAKARLPLDPELGKHAGLRSLHNNYFTLPVLFVMVSNHFPSTFGYQYPWLALLVISAGAAGVKHYLNLRERRQQSVWVLPVSVLILLAAAFITAPPLNPDACTENVSFQDVNEVIQKRCVSCHASRPTDDVYKTAPNGVAYDTPEDIVRKKDLILQRVVLTKTMPQNNKTNMTEAERNLIRCWIEQGAPLR